MFTRFTSSNFGQFLATRKFWQPIITWLLTLLIWATPQITGVDLSSDAQLLMTAILWGIAGVVVHGDIRYDWLKATPVVARAESQPAPPAAG